MMNSSVPAYVFGPFRLLPLERRLLEGERAVRLGSRAMDLLLALLERAGDIVDKHELLALVWPNAVVDDATLRVHLAALRKVLGDGRDGQRYITTVAGRGYGFLAPVARAGEAAAAGTAVAEVRHNLPVLLTRMMGRGDIVQAMAGQLLQVRLLSIVGPGGIGKTTVAVALAMRVLRRHADGVCFVDLAPVAEGQLAPLALATALGVAVPAHDPMPALLAYLRQRQMLIVFDNCEHVIAAAAALADMLLKGAPALQVLATSREPLRISCEQLLRLPVLELPPLDAAPDAALRHYAAVQLFAERCAAVDASFVLADADLPVVAEICRRLDGIPLALELAAGRIGHFGLHGLRRQLDDRFRLLVRGPRNAPLRHQTLRATLDWSYGLLDAEERSVLQALSVFKNRFRLESAIAVAGRDVYDTVADLASKSLVSVETCCERVYYRLLETTRAYACAHLALAGEQAAVFRRHALHCLALARCIAADWERLPAASWSASYRRHVDDMRAAIDWAFGAHGDLALGVALTLATHTLFYQLSLMDEYRLRVEHALARMAAQGVDDAGSELRLRVSLGHLLLHTEGVSGAMLAQFQRASRLAPAAGESGGCAEALCGLWIAQMALADFRAADACAAQFAALCERDGDTAMQLVRARMLAAGEHLQGRHAEAAVLSRLVLDHPDGAGQRSLNNALLADHQVCLRGNLARCLWLMGRPDDALEIAREAVELGFAHNGVSLCVALAFSAIPVALWCGQHALARTWTCVLCEHAARHGLLYWHGWGGSYQAALDGGGQSGAASAWPLQADVMATLFDAAASGEALRRARAGEAPWSAPEVLRRAALRRWQGLRAGDAEGLELVRRLLDEALRLAGTQRALGWELRCATSLAAVMRAQGRSGEARALLLPVHGRYTQGHASADVMTATALLAALA
ncbi:winged helix-turn-helix domain-containing protein [Janthinobacterium sp. J1-1]|uniref:ATP-binding protein n=1 Tax=Janthinobacterium sp. J1-1 TaxID=3065910 RepID=UPI002810BDD3|nr:winged helix-turn-helix domain-containing protein [Janthinobacterium sp. J1-1]